MTFSSRSTWYIFCRADSSSEDEKRKNDAKRKMDDLNARIEVGWGAAHVGGSGGGASWGLDMRHQVLKYTCTDNKTERFARNSAGTLILDWRVPKHKTSQEKIPITGASVPFYWCNRAEVST